MKILGITCATNTMGAALADKGIILAECSVSGESARSEKLVPLMERIMNETSRTPKDLDAIAITIGPGSYSGLRGGLAAAKAMCSSLSIPLLSVATLDASSYNFVEFDGAFAVMLHACKDEYNMALFGASGGRIKRLTGDFTAKLEAAEKVFAKVEGRITIACDRDISGVIKNKNVRLAGPEAAIPWARNVALLGGIKFASKDHADVLSVVPTYSHKPNIREFKKHA